MFNFKLSFVLSSVPAVLILQTPITSFTTLAYITRNNIASKQCTRQHVHHPSFINTKKRFLQYSSSLSLSEEEDHEETKEHTELQQQRRRILREKRESLLKERYVMGNELIELRERITHTEKLIKHVKGRKDDVNELKKQVRELRSRDAEFVYGVAMKEMKDARDEKDVRKWRQIAMDARSCIPHFNLQGLWVGKYGSHGYEMINITYAGDNLIAYKVTGDKNVPRGEITFQADLTPTIYQSSKPSSSTTSSPSPRSLNDNSRKLDPIQLTETAAKQWGVKQLQRFPGLGHVADVDFTRNQWLDGQFIMIGQNYFSFAWVPIGCQIFFGRPSQELIMNMMREKVYMTDKIEQLNDSISDQVEVQNMKLSELDIGTMRTIASRSMDETIAIMEEEEVTVNQIHFDKEGCWE